MENRKPYSYVINCPDGRRYYGIRYAKNCHPSDLWEKYFTSSETIKEMIKEFGKEAFTYEVRKIFDTPSEALAWERKVLRRLNVVESENWINLTYLNGGWNPVATKSQRESASKTHKGKTISEEQRKLISEKMKGRFVSEETRKKRSDTMKGRKFSDEHLENLSKSRKSSEKFQQHVKKNCELARKANTGRKRPEHSKHMKERAAEHNKKYHTPKGVFILRDACEFYGRDMLREWCNNCDKVITRMMISKSSCLTEEHLVWVGKTRREVGFYIID